MRRTAFADLALLSALLLAAPSAALAQHEASAALVISVPLDEFDDNTDTGFGFQASYVRALHPSRAIAIGATGSFLNYGSAERRVALSPTIPDIRADVETNNNMGFLQGLIRLKAPLDVVQPYVQGTAGLGFFATTTTLEDIVTDEAVISDTNQSDVTYVWGGGGGMQIHVYTSEQTAEMETAGREPMRVYLDVGAHYLEGGEAEYLREGSLVTDEGRFDLDRRLVESEIELAQVRIGVSFEF
ncbi:MAG: hypothetical protein R3199_06190 [Gemmatimonadota bacterium]|nr:hypothetical protein [Gemmatimonadota bacterium]